MRHLLYHDLKRCIDLKRTVIAAIMAVTALFFFVQFFSQDMTEDRLLDKLHIGIIDHENSELSAMLIESFKSNDKFTSLVDIAQGPSDHVMDIYGTGQLTAVITIPENFTTSLLHYENEPLEVIINPKHPLRATVISEMLSSYSEYIKAVDASTYGLYTTLQESGFPADRLKQTNDLYSLEMISTALGRNQIFKYTAVDTFPATTSGIYFGSAIIVMIIAFSTSGIIPLLFEDLRLSCAQRYMTITHGLFPWIASKLVSMSLNAALLSIAIALPLVFVFELSLKQTGIFLIQILVLSLFYSVLAMTIGVYTRNEASATVTTNLLYFLLGLAGGNFIPIPLMPKSIQDISAFTPNYWAIKSLLHNIAGIETNWIPLVGLVAGAVLVMIGTNAVVLKKTLREGGVLYE